MEFQDRLEILLNSELDSITVNQIGKITNTQFEELQNKITQAILKKEVQEIFNGRELKLGDLGDLDIIWSNIKNHSTLLSNIEQYQKAISESMAHCSAMWSDVRKLGHIVQQCEHCSRNHSTLLKNVSNLVEHQLSILTKINKEIEIYTQQRYLITYVNKGKGKLQTPAVTPKKIQPPTWKKTRVESPINPSYYYTPKSAINITDASTSNTTSTFGQFLFQSKQKKEDLLGLYGAYFKRFKSQLLMPSGLQSSLPQPDFRTASF
ncbi:hypothetical protein G9A89_008591 [Geosiphon pyriformis]|nr:hypothetical protein G9A89_008591 [Geosiphon pyriformis]